MLKFRMKRKRGQRKSWTVRVGRGATMSRGGYTEGYANDICRKLKEGNYVEVTTDVNINKVAQNLQDFEGNAILQPNECRRTSHSVLLVMGDTLLKSESLTQKASDTIKPTDLVVIDSNAGSFFKSLGGENIASLENVDDVFRKFGNHDNYVSMVKDIQGCLLGDVGIKVFGHDFMVKEYDDLFEEVKFSKDGVCGVFTEVAARWFQDPYYSKRRKLNEV